jgi:hypothetical protein
LCLTVIGCGRRATLLALLRLPGLSWRRRLTRSALHSFSLDARRIRGSATGRRGDRLPNSGWRTSSTLLMFSCAKRCRRAESLTLKSSAVTLRRGLSCTALRGIWLLAWSSRRLPTMLLLFRRCTLDT